MARGRNFAIRIVIFAPFAVFVGFVAYLGTGGRFGRDGSDVVCRGKLTCEGGIGAELAIFECGKSGLGTGSGLCFKLDEEMRKHISDTGFGTAALAGAVFGALGGAGDRLEGVPAAEIAGVLARVAGHEKQ